MKTCKIACCTISRPEDLNGEAVQLAARIKGILRSWGYELGSQGPR